MHKKFLDRLTDNCLRWAKEDGVRELERRADLFSPLVQELVTKTIVERRKQNGRS